MSNYGQAFDDDWMNVDAFEIAPPSYQPFVPTSYNTQNDFGFGNMQTMEEEDYSNEPPLLEELGIDFSHIFKKILVVIRPWKSIDEALINDADLKGRIQFGYTFGYFFAGCTLIYVLLKLLSDSSSNDISLTSVMSILGYCMIPLLFFSMFSLFLPFKNIVGWIFAVLCILWSSFTASRFIESLLKSNDQRYIIMYPLVLLYAVFALITVF